MSTHLDTSFPAELRAYLRAVDKGPGEKDTGLFEELPRCANEVGKALDGG
jgi:hypothetical protein